jgi:hypothetical protein
VTLAQHLALAVQRLSVQSLGSVAIAFSVEENREVAHGGECVSVTRPQHFAPRLKRLVVQ